MCFCTRILGIPRRAVSHPSHPYLSRPGNDRQLVRHHVTGADKKSWSWDSAPHAASSVAQVALFTRHSVTASGESCCPDRGFAGFGNPATVSWQPARGLDLEALNVSVFSTRVAGAHAEKGGWGWDVAAAVSPASRFGTSNTPCHLKLVSSAYQN